MIRVTGGKGFLGKQLVRKLKEERKYPNVMVTDLPEYDLRTLHGINKMFDPQTTGDKLEKLLDVSRTDELR